MFDLESAIATWRASAALQESITPAAADELEGHLRDQVADLAAAGLTDEEAFGVALRRLGQPTDLAPEFAAATPGTQWRRRIFWGILGYLEISVMLALAATLGKTTTWLAALSGLTGNLPAIALGAHILFFVAIASGAGWIWYHVSKDGFPDLGELYTRYPARIAVLTVVALVLIKVGGYAATTATVQVASAETFGAVVMWTSYHSVVAHTIALAGLAVAMSLTGRVFRQPAAAA